MKLGRDNIEAVCAKYGLTYEPHADYGERVEGVYVEWAIDGRLPSRSRVWQAMRRVPAFAKDFPPAPKRPIQVPMAVKVCRGCHERRMFACRYYHIGFHPRLGCGHMNVFCHGPKRGPWLQNGREVPKECPRYLEHVVIGQKRRKAS